MVNVFQNLRIEPLTLGGTRISWNLHPELGPGLPITMNVQVSRLGVPDSQDWVTINPAPIVSSTPTATFSVTDTQQRAWSSAEQVYYRVTVDTDDLQSYKSAPTLMWGDLPKHKALMLKMILRNELLRFKQVCSCGLLFKRKTWGVRCTNPGCVDPDTGEVRMGNCPVCFGTGWVSGYATPVAFYVDFSTGQPTRLRRDDPQGMHDGRVQPGRCITCPLVQTGDIFMEPASDNRWIAQTIDNVVSVNNYQAVLNVEWRQLEPTDVAQELNEDHVG